GEETMPACSCIITPDIVQIEMVVYPAGVLLSESCWSIPSSITNALCPRIVCLERQALREAVLDGRIECLITAKAEGDLQRNSGEVRKRPLGVIVRRSARLNLVCIDADCQPIRLGTDVIEMNDPVRRHFMLDCEIPLCHLRIWPDGRTHISGILPNETGV